MGNTLVAVLTRGAPPQPLPPAAESDVPEGRLFRVKSALLGKPLHTDQLIHERLGKPTALAVFASDNLSSSAYATEEILRVLLPVVGIAAFTLVMPITIAMLVVLAFLILSYRQTIKAYPFASGAYNVTTANFGPPVPQVAGAALLIDYVLTVAVSTAAGTAALTSAFSALRPYRIEIAIAFVLIIAYGNLRGLKESGRIFAVPTYFFMVNMILLLAVGLVRWAMGDLPTQVLEGEGLVEVGSAGAGLLQGASLFVVLHAFASGGAAVTGVEAISDGVPAFRKPEWRNARTTLVVMGVSLGVMFLGLSFLASRTHVGVFEEGVPTVLSQIGEIVYGHGATGEVLYYCLQAGTMLILVLAANTSFADFPRLASFQAGDSFLPKQLTKRGHRLVFSNGIIALAGAAIIVLLLTKARVEALIPLYAVGVFLSFTLSQSAMSKHHLREREPGWQRGLAINGFGAFLSALVCLIIAITKFVDGAWIVLVLLPAAVLLLLRLNRQYTQEDTELEHEAELAATAPILRRHVVLVLIDRLDRSTARAIQYARTLTPDELRAVHIAADELKAEALADEWRRLGLSRISLELIDCPDRRITRCTVNLVDSLLVDGQTEVSVLIPRRIYRRAWHRLLHDRTADAIAEALAPLPHANVTVVPYHLGGGREPVAPARVRPGAAAVPGAGGDGRDDGQR
ncbi:MAG TPA: APC family permease [Acidimicrobiales bacterium]|nr:APC family permease [Acidimicrobiales bacterium]